MDFLKICRACTSEKTNLLNLFANDCDDEPTLGEKFLVCTSLDLQEADSYPQHICYSCAKLLETAYKFRKQCERSFSQLQKRLHSMQKNSQKNIKVEPTEVINNVKVESICVDDDDDDDNDNSLGDNEIIDSEEYVDNPTSITSREEEDVEVDHSDNMTQGDEVRDEPKSLPPIPNETEKQLIDVNITIQERPHECNQCGKSFFTTKALELHMKLTHKLKRTETIDDTKNAEIHHSHPHICSICDKQLANIDDLRMHRILTHGAKALKCNICGKSMRDRIAYRKHLLSHNNSERYDCKICGKQYTDVRYLHRHMLYHQVSMYKCEEPNCEKYFNVKHKCVEHIRLYHNRNLTSDEVRQMMPTDEL